MGLAGHAFTTLPPYLIPLFETVSLTQAGLGLLDRLHTGNPPAPTSQLLR